MDQNQKFNFNISLSVLNHLGRNLYRSFVTIVGEAISNAWDADAENVWINISEDGNSFVIKDDGEGMSDDDFQNKFLKIGYSKRKGGLRNSLKRRPYIGRKGIGKLALLSCASKITVISKKRGENYIGGCIDNEGLDKAITDDLNSSQYVLGDWDIDKLAPYISGHDKGTIILFEGVKGGIKNTLSYIKRIIAMYFRFSLLDETFNIFVDGEKVTHKYMSEIGAKTQFLWRINQYNDPYLSECLSFLKSDQNITSDISIKGFIATVERPRDLKIRETDEKISLDLFVNGRLREKDVLKNIPSNRIVESYLYGQIHFDSLDDGDDPFTSSREGVVSDNESYRTLLARIQSKILPQIIEDWDKLRLLHGNDGDPDNTRMTRKERKSEELYNAVSNDFNLDDEDPHRATVNKWAEEMRDDAKFSFASFAECYISENLLRRYISEKRIAMSKQAEEAIQKYQNNEKVAKGKGNISIDIRRDNNKLSYLSMDDLASLFDKGDKHMQNNLYRDSCEYKPIRDALMHTALLSDVAKARLTMTYENIKGRLRELLSGRI